MSITRELIPVSSFINRIGNAPKSRPVYQLTQPIGTIINVQDRIELANQIKKITTKITAEDGREELMLPQFKSLDTDSKKRGTFYTLKGITEDLETSGQNNYANISRVYIADTSEKQKLGQFRDFTSYGDNYYGNFYKTKNDVDGKLQSHSSVSALADGRPLCINGKYTLLGLDDLKKDHGK